MQSSIASHMKLSIINNYLIVAYVHKGFFHLSRFNQRGVCSMGSLLGYPDNLKFIPIGLEPNYST